MENNNVENSVMREIESGKVKLRSRYIFAAEKLGLGSAVVLSVLLVVLVANLLLYYLRATDNLSYLSFGRNGILAFLESFPYLLVVMMVFCIFLAGFLLKQTGSLYKKPFVYLALGLVVLALIGGGALAMTSVDEQLENEAYAAHSPARFFQPLLQHDFGGDQRGVAGRVVAVSSSMFVVQTPDGQRFVQVPAAFSPLLSSVTAGDFVIAVGTRSGTTFLADHIRIVGPSEMPMVRRTIHRRFDVDVPPPGPTDPSNHRCFNVCSPGAMCGSVCGMQ